MSNTIRKNTKAATRVFELATRCTVHSLDNLHRGRSIDVDRAETVLHEFKFAFLCQVDDERFRVSVHSNLWYDLFCEPRINEDSESGAEAHDRYFDR